MAAFGSDPENAERMFLWQGPLNYQDGTEFLPEGEFAEPLDIWYMPQLIEGMIGASS
jgi:simple sugar transport system substrate-binding protein